MTLLSDADISRRVMSAPREEVIELWKSESWDEIGEGLYIDPFDSGKLGVCTYDLSVGPEYISLRDPYTTKGLADGDQIEIGPGEMVLILAEEYIALPRSLAAFVVPRARFIFQGGAINATRIDPTWYGRLLVGFTNLSKYPFALGRGEEFCTCLFVHANQPKASLASKGVAHLGRDSISRIETPNIRPRDLREPSEIGPDEMREVVSLFGHPFDVVRGTIEQSRTEIVEHINRDVAPDVVIQARSEAKSEAFDRLLDLQESWVKWQRIFVTGMLAAFSAFFGVLAWLVSTALMPP